MNYRELAYYVANANRLPAAHRAARLWRDACLMSCCGWVLALAWLVTS